ncbi:MAG: type II toxin-antitoxin system Phd/YefM family antitoxin [Nitrospirota bacterium]|nr:type II toxin-antitoxin system Phd/YefM family antitoxin [Nitrospirota bacterium]MDE3225017.1 type II toxin-antitoxin system Phd/YefM family antitoxin [Nitrospirota bacterium]MDE3243430.1 type II toxin-antitoxin system Phd/YefM family antitoxin [Nitrospirota bacterium]
MRTVNIATLKAKLSEYVRLAKRGERIRILDRRRAVAELSGLQVSDDQRIAQDLLRAGQAEWHGGKPQARPMKLRKGPANIAAAVLEDRG